ncbi:MAG TPA: amino acid permease [Bryobacteraceae bacterium]|jgi:L-asparagine transporter-like permease
MIEEREKLSRQLSAPQLAMIAIGGAIGTGLFLGSALAVHTAGPGVILTYLLGAGIALLLVRALGEMAVAHPTAGSFGVYAETYLNSWAGFTVRYTYWAGQCVAIGGEATAIAIYCQWWFPHTPQWIWILAFTIGLLYVNARSVGSFGGFEYWFAMIKVIAIILFIVMGAALILGVGPRPAIGFSNLTASGGFIANGWRGVWMAIVFVIFSYIGTEVIAVTAGEAKNPEIALPRAVRSMAARLILFYLGAIFVLITIVPWTQVQPGAGVTASPFVRVFELVGIHAAAHIVNFVVITAAASSMNCNLYLVSRMMFSLSRGGYAPESWGRVSSRGTPVRALLVSAAGLGLALLTSLLYPESAFVYLFGISLFGGLYAWLIIFVTHIVFRNRGQRSISASSLGAVSIAAILLTTWWVEGMRITLIAGLSWLALLSVAYWFAERRRSSKLI